MRQLVRQALRMRPDRIVVGECRGAEVAELLGSLNTGHEGGAGTVHANSPTDVPARLEALVAPSGMSRAALHSQLGSAVQCVLHMRRGPAGRLLAEIAILRHEAGGHVVVEPVWTHGKGDAAALPLLTKLVSDRRRS